MATIAKAAESFDKATAKELDSHLKAIDEAKAAMVGGVLTIGQHLSAVHDLLSGAGRDGAFLPWVEENCDFTSRTAYRYMGAFRTFGKCDMVSHFSDTAMYLLSKDSVPEEATEQAIKFAKRGHKITEAKAKEIIEQVNERIAQELADDDPEPTSESALPSATQVDDAPGDGGDEPAEEESATATDGPEPTSEERYAMRKEAKAALGKVVRLFDDAGIYEASRAHFDALHTAAESI